MRGLGQCDGALSFCTRPQKAEEGYTDDVSKATSGRKSFVEPWSFLFDSHTTSRGQTHEKGNQLIFVPRVSTPSVSSQRCAVSRSHDSVNHEYKKEDSAVLSCVFVQFLQQAQTNSKRPFARFNTYQHSRTSAFIHISTHVHTNIHTHYHPHNGP